jgi:hypothetical protein
VGVWLVCVVAFWWLWWYGAATVPTVSLRLSDAEHARLREWAFGARRSLQREIVFRLFDGAVVTERGVTVPPAGSGKPLREGVADLPRSVTAVPSVVHDVQMQRRVGCGFDTPKGTKCKLCGKEH